MEDQNQLPSLLRMIVNGTARHVLTSVATLLAGYGAINHDQETQFVSIAGGIVVWLAGVAWSAANKKNVTNAVAAASVPQPDPANEAPH